jgi:hypothetical protein
MVAPELKTTAAGKLRRVRNIASRVFLAVIAIVMLRVVWHFVQRDDPKAVIEGRAESDLRERRDYLGAHMGEAAKALAPNESQFAGEWSIVTLSMTAIAAANIGFEHSDTVPADLELVTRCAEAARRKESRAFDSARWSDDPIDAMDGPSAHIGYLGHLAMILEAHRLLGGRDAELAALETKVIAALTTKLRDAPSGLLPTYPNETYVADNAVVLAALALSDVGRAAKPHAQLLKTTLSTWRATLIDKDTGVLVFSPTHVPKHVDARASGAALSAMMLWWVDETFAKEQSQAIAAHFDDDVFGLFGAVCEFAGCTGGSGDVDSGPLVRGASPSATGFAIALAKRGGDEKWLGRLLATAEWAGLGFPGAENAATSSRRSSATRSCWRPRARARGTCDIFPCERAASATSSRRDHRRPRSASRQSARAARHARHRAGPRGDSAHADPDRRALHGPYDVLADREGGRARDRSRRAARGRRIDRDAAR